ncbi:MAG: hypothetical protein KAI72_00935, partial [Candidatus Pacebacteria bacterium]|nr:hypothetical protein [Candidatus Paceibacterota bacterium]
MSTKKDLENNQVDPHGSHPEGKAMTWTRILYGIAVLLAVAGYFLLGVIGIAALPIFVFLVNVMITGWINRPKEFTVIERGGHFYKILDEGFHWYVLFFDRPVGDPFRQLSFKRTVTTRRRKINLFSKGYEEKKEIITEIKKHLNFQIAKIDYTDVYGLDTYVTHFGGIGYEDGSSQEELYNHIYNFIYRYNNVASRIMIIADGFIRPELQRKKVEEANVEGLNLWGMEGVDKKSKKKAKKDSLEIGWIFEENPFVMVDIDMPEKVEGATQDAFAERKKGEGAADRIDKGFFGPIKDMT